MPMQHGGLHPPAARQRYEHNTACLLSTSPMNDACIAHGLSEFRPQSAARVPMLILYPHSTRAVIQPSLVPGADRGESEQAATAAPQRGSGYRLPQRDAACLANSVRERRRMNRIAEQKRRDALKHSLLDLRALIPAPAPVHDAEGSSGGGTPGQLHTKSAVIRQSMSYRLLLCFARTRPKA